MDELQRLTVARLGCWNVRGRWAEGQRVLISRDEAALRSAPFILLKSPRVDVMTRDLSSKESTVVATYSNHQDAEMARGYLEDHDIASFVGADDVHPLFQLTEGGKTSGTQQ